MEDALSSRVNKYPNAWQAAEQLDDLLIHTTDLDEACTTALSHILEVSGRPAGLIIVSIPEEKLHTLCFQHNLPARWAALRNDTGSALYKLAEYTLQHQQPISPDNLPEGIELPENFAAALPLSAQAEPQGVLLVLGAACSPEEMEQLSHLTPVIGRAISVNRQLKSSQERVKHLAALHVDLMRMAFNAELEDLQTRLIGGVCDILGSETCALILLDEAHEEWLIRKTLSESAEWVYQVNLREGKGLVRECLRSRKPLRVNDVIADPRFDPSSDALNGQTVQSILCAPLIADGQMLGVLQVINKHQGAYDEHDQEMLATIAILAAQAIQSTRLIQQLKVANADLEASRWELSNTRSAFSALFDNLPAALYMIDPHYRITAINLQRAQRLNMPLASITQQVCYQVLFNRTEPCSECRVSETLQHNISTQRSERRWGAGDEVIELEIRSIPVVDEEGNVSQAILLEQDVTEKRRLEALLAQSEKLATVGQLAAGVAHEINNPLTAIIANAQILHRELPINHDLQESVDLIARAGARATQVVRNLLDFARKEEYHLNVTDVNETLERALELVHHEIVARGVQLTFDPSPDLPSILASQDHLQSVWLNLLLNAIDSLDKSPGQIRVSTRQIGHDIQVSFTDNGKGIAPEHLTRIFEPFYTTKAPGRGTGLGLSVSHRIVKQHGGAIRVESRVGVGSTFTVILPLA